ncbi:MAG: hypothetical protein ACRDTF_07645 [Pseudonocardiaceae bacterium]
MTVARSVADVLADHVTFQVESIDRMYLNMWVPRLAYGGGVSGFFVGQTHPTMCDSGSVSWSSGVLELSGSLSSVRVSEPYQDREESPVRQERGSASERRRPGPVYDDAMKILADDDLSALLSVLGVRGAAERLNVELAASTMKADLLARTPTGIVHVEFVKDPTPDLGIRMVEYWLRLRRQHRSTPITQYVLALRDIPIPDRYVDLDGRQLGCAWTVVRLPELDPAVLLAAPTTAALAALARGTPTQRGTVLAAAAERITAEVDPERREVLIAAAATLASIVLPGHTIVTALKEVTMPVPVRDTPLGRELYEEGRHEGRQEGDRQAVLRLTGLMLRQRFGDHPGIEAIARQLAALPDEERLTRLTSATSLDDLQH